MNLGGKREMINVIISSDEMNDRYVSAGPTQSCLVAASLRSEFKRQPLYGQQRPLTSRLKAASTGQFQIVTLASEANETLLKWQRCSFSRLQCQNRVHGLTDWIHQNQYVTSNCSELIRQRSTLWIVPFHSFSLFHTALSGFLRETFKLVELTLR